MNRNIIFPPSSAKAFFIAIAAGITFKAEMRQSKISCLYGSDKGE